MNQNTYRCSIPHLLLGCLLLSAVPIHSQGWADKGNPEALTQVQLMVEQAQAAATAIKDRIIREDVLVRIAGLHTRLGNRDRAQAIVETIQGPWPRDHALLQVCWGLAEMGDRPAARNAAEQISIDINRDYALTLLAREQARAGESQEARRTTEMVAANEWKAKALASIGLALSVSGKLAEADDTFEYALRLALGTEDKHQKFLALARIAPLQIETGDRTRAIRTLDFAGAVLGEMERSSNRDFYEIMLAWLQARAGLYSEAFQTVQNLEDEHAKSEALMSVAQEQAAEGYLNLSLITIEAIPEESDRAEALSVVATELSKTGRFDEALGTVSRMPSGYWQRPPALALIARGLALHDKRNHAERVFRQALAGLLVVKDEILEGHARTLVATSLAEAGYINEALRAVSAIDDESDRENALSGIAYQQTRRGDGASALAWIATLDAPRLRASALASVAWGALELVRQRKPNSREP